MIGLIFLMAQTLGPVLPDNQWRPLDKAYPWPLPASEWDVIYYHGDEAVNGQPPSTQFQWQCHLYEREKRATCVSSWEIKAGTLCRLDRPHVPWEHPYIWYETYRGDGTHTDPYGKRKPRSRAFFWAYSQQLVQWPEWNKVPEYAWEYDRLQWIPSGPNCDPRQGCAPRATYYIQEFPGAFVFDTPNIASSLIPPNAPTMTPVDQAHTCRGFLFNSDWCVYNPSRPECNNPSKQEIK